MSVTPNISVSVSAAPKTGKTHFALTFPDPIKVFSFDSNAKLVARKFPDKKIDVEEFILPVIEDTDCIWALPVWDKFHDAFVKAVESKQYQTVVLDPFSSLADICQQALLEEVKDTRPGRKKLDTTEYLSRNLRLSALFARADVNGVNLVVTQHMRDVWVKSTTTGKMEMTGDKTPDGWGRTGAYANVNLIARLKTKGSKTLTEFTIESNLFDRGQNGSVHEDLTYDDLVALLIP